ncbi:MAG: RraA family protein [Pseudomonadota bacterium]
MPTSLVGDQLQRLHGITALTRIHGDAPLLGFARTVKVRPGDNLFVTHALHDLEPGEVLVVDGAGCTVNALVGELLMLYAQQRGCAGFVIDGAVRDVDAFRAAGFPCYARGTSLRGPYKDGPGEVGVPVAVGGQVVLTGDVVLGDGDGIVTFAPAQLQMVLERARAKLDIELAVKAEIANGEREQSWLPRR